MRVMVVDDSRTIRKLLSITLKSKVELVEEIVECVSGEVALRKLEDINVDLILLDVLMDGMDGYETCKKIKEHPKLKNISVIFLTSKADEEDIIKGFEVGGVDFITKPFREAELVARVNTHLKLQKLQDNVIEKNQTEIVMKMGEIAELRSKETGNHVKRVAEYCYLLAYLHGLDEKHCQILYAASPMHDIGKVALEDSILNKAGSLSDEEVKIMQKHTVLGYEMFSDSKGDILSAAAIMAHEHHEKFDGTGYPRGISGNKIHIYGRIVALADVFDALASDRVYKKGWSIDRIVELFISEKSKHFDPYLVDIFVKNIDKFIAIKKEFNDNFT
ncbi:MAG: response regulator [Campylobacterota bacterium]|nr:response regulator [Campylobacterota bacterium]